MNSRPRILVLTLSFGSGHVRAAGAVAAELKRSVPGAEVLVLDALENPRALFRCGYVWPYQAMMRYAPGLWHRFFEARAARQTAPAWAFRRGCPQVFDVIARFKPQTIIAVEVAAGEMAAIARREGLTCASIISVITDYEAGPAWVKEEVNAYAVAGEGVASQLCEWGAARERIAVTGIPTDAGFGIRHERKATRARLGIRDDLPLVLLMDGGMGRARMDEIAKRLSQGYVAMHVVALAGTDARAYKKLVKINSKKNVCLHILGWTDEVAALMQAATVLVTKPGGLALAEAARCALPVVMFDGISGPEIRNAERFAAQGAGILTKDPDETAAAVKDILLNEDLRFAMSLRSVRLARPEAAGEVVRLALSGAVEAGAQSWQRMTAWRRRASKEAKLTRAGSC